MSTPDPTAPQPRQTASSEASAQTTQENAAGQADRNAPSDQQGAGPDAFGLPEPPERGSQHAFDPGHEASDEPTSAPAGGYGQQWSDPDPDPSPDAADAEAPDAFGMPEPPQRGAQHAFDAPTAVPPRAGQPTSSNDPAPVAYAPPAQRQEGSAQVPPPYVGGEPAPTPYATQEPYPYHVHPGQGGGQQQAGYRGGQPTGYQQQSAHQQSSGYPQAAGNAEPAEGYAQPAGGYRQQPPAYGQQQPGYGQQPPAYGQQQPGYGQQPPAYGQQQPGHGQQAGQQPHGYGQSSHSQQPGYSQQAPSAGYGYGSADPYAKSRTIAGILGILLGGLGVHRFYLGYVGIGLAQIAVTIVTFGVGAIWGFVEGILYLTQRTGQFSVDSTGRPLKD